MVSNQDNKYIIYSDGASRGNPGHSAAAYVIYQDNKAVLSSGEYLGITTSLVAEYYALKIALEAALALGATKLECRADNLSLIEQLTKSTLLKNRDVWPIYENITDLARQFQQISFVHINRELNQMADQMANDILDAYSLAKV